MQLQFTGDSRWGGVGRAAQEYLSRFFRACHFSRGREPPSIRYTRDTRKTGSMTLAGLWVLPDTLQMLPRCSPRCSPDAPQVLSSGSTGPWEHEDVQSLTGDLYSCCWELPTGSVSLQTSYDYVIVGWAHASCQALADHSQCMNPKASQSP